MSTTSEVLMSESPRDGDDATTDERVQLDSIERAKAAK